MGVTVSFEFSSLSAAAQFMQIVKPTVDAMDGQIEYKTPVAAARAEDSAPSEEAAPAKRRKREPKEDKGLKYLSEKESPAARPVYTEADAQAALESVFKARGIQTARDLLSRYGAKRVSEVKAEFYTQFIDHAQKVLNGESV